ncbi:metallophosphoesterase [Bosea sp. 2KB_26]|uniref:metallophosphoesterase n=1 Tax=Bosea sp. 2KB_26 TaxID=3237475 RepID=UPI003F933394
MRLLVLSDIHLEFGSFSLPEKLDDFDVAVFAGDIGRPIVQAIQWIEQQRRGPLRGRPAVFVVGNHELYGSEINAALSDGIAMAERYGIHMLAPGCVVLGGTRFIGATLWTDYDLYGNPAGSRRVARRAMNDHGLIQISENEGKRLFTPEDAEAAHRSELAFITRQLAQPFSGATVMVTHHAPHPGSIQPRYRGDPLSPAFTSDLSALIERYQPELWIHGHDHGSHDYRVGLTRVVSNQAGYPLRGGGRENPSFNPCLIVDVGKPT